MIDFNFNNFFREIKISSLFLSIPGALANYKRSNSNLWTNTLCYFSIICMVPILAIIFSISRWLNIDSFLIENLAKSSPLDRNTINFLIDTTQTLLENTRNGIIAGVGFFLLGFSVISMFSIIEKSFNSIWQVKSTRGFVEKVGDYFIIFLSLPLTVLSISIVNQQFEVLLQYKFLNKLTPYAALWAFFIIFYTIIPNIKIQPVHTLISSLFVSILLNQSNIILVKLQTFIHEYNKIYGSFSIILIFLIWLKIIWFIILIGAHFTYILQNRAFLHNIEGIKNLNLNSKERVATIILIEFIKNFISNEPPLILKQVSDSTKLPMSIAYDMISFLKEKNIISEIKPKVSTHDNFYKLSFNHNELTLDFIKRVFEEDGDNLVGDYQSFHNESLDKKIIDFIENEDKI